MHMLAHIRRVRLLGVALLALDPGSFPEIDPKILSRFLGLHDQSKVNQSSRFLAEHHLNNERRILDRLYQNYGKNFDALPESEKQGALDLVFRLNDVDRNVAMGFFKAYGMLTAQGEPNAMALQLLRIEKIADSVDRGESPVSSEEFHKIMTPASAMMKDPQDQKLAKTLEEHYAMIVHGATYRDYKLRHSELPYCNRAFELLR